MTTNSIEQSKEIYEIMDAVKKIPESQYRLLKALLLSSETKEDFMNIAKLRMTELHFASFEEADDFTKVIDLAENFPSDQCKEIRSLLSTSKTKDEFLKNIEV